MQGWRLAGQDTAGPLVSDQFAARLAAECMAFASHRETGRPTGVKVRMACGDWALVGMRG